MIKRSFWEKVASLWCKEEEIMIPIITDDPLVPEDIIELDELEDWDSLLKDIMGSDID